MNAFYFPKLQAHAAAWSEFGASFTASACHPTLFAKRAVADWKIVIDQKESNTRWVVAGCTSSGLPGGELMAGPGQQLATVDNRIGAPVHAGLMRSLERHPLPPFSKPPGRRPGPRGVYGSDGRPLFTGHLFCPVRRAAAAGDELSDETAAATRMARESDG